MGYVTVSYRGIKYTHFGGTSRQKPLYRRYTEYLGPWMAMLINTPMRFIVVNLPIRFFGDLIRAIVNNDVILLIHAYSFLTKNLKYLIAHRVHRARIYKNQSIFMKMLSNCIK
jgi:hypothetical protein